MAYTTSQQLNKYYSLYKNINITFSKEVMMAINFVPKKVFIRSSEGQWPCVINSVSMTSAKIIVPKASGLVDTIQSGSSAFSIRFTFFEPEGKDTLSFFVSSKLIGVSDYDSNGGNFVLASFEYTQRAPDDLIDKLGSLIDANVASKNRKDERIILTKDNKRRISLEKNESVIFIDGIPRRCILRDLSFSGTKIFIAGVANFLINKDVTVRFSFEEPSATFGIKGKTVRAERVENRKDLVAVAIDYDTNSIPMLYKMYLNRYFSVTRKNENNEDDSLALDDELDVENKIN